MLKSNLKQAGGILRDGHYSKNWNIMSVILCSHIFLSEGIAQSALWKAAVTQKTTILMA